MLGKINKKEKKKPQISKLRSKCRKKVTVMTLDNNQTSLYNTDYTRLAGMQKQYCRSTQEAEEAPLLRV